MKKWLASLLVCPECRSDLDLFVFADADDGTITDGLFRCTGCKLVYMIVGGIPRMLCRDLYQNEDFERDYFAEIATVSRGEIQAEDGQYTMGQLQRNTINSFGWEWHAYDRFGWDHKIFNIEKEQERFVENTLFDLEELQGKLMLDGGCGNGRYMLQCARQGAEVVGMDLSHAVEVAQRNLDGHDKVHFVQGDLFKPPFRKRSFDIAFSIGVLMHTGNAQKAFTSLAHCVKDKGKMAISVYQKQNLLHEFNDRWIRAFTIRFPNRLLQDLSRAASRIAKALWKIRLLGLINAFFRLEPLELCVYDWYKAPVATHHRRDEVHRWFRDAGAVNIMGDERCDQRNGLQKFIWPRCGFTMQGRIGNNSGNDVEGL